MEFKTPTEDMKAFVERAQEFWENIDMEQLQPVFHDSETVDEEEMTQRLKALELAEKNMELYIKQRNDHDQNEILEQQRIS